MQFIVPQFIDVESKIIGPISVRQFIILLISAGCCFIFNKLFTPPIFIASSFLTIVIGGLLAFARVNGQAMHYFLLNLFQTMRRPRLTVWWRMPASVQHAESVEVQTVVTPRQTASQSRLAAVSLMVDTEGQYQGHFNQPSSPSPTPPPPTIAS